MATKTNKEFKVDLKDLKVEIEKHPMAESKNMFESFLLIGYDDLYYQEKIIPYAIDINNNIKNEPIKEKEKKKNDDIIFRRFRCRNLPTILNSITSDFTGPILTGDQIILDVFPLPPEILCDPFENKDIPPEIKTNHVIFSNIQNNVVNYGYAYIFYEKKNHEKLKIYIPKAFVIISQYPLFNIFTKLCEEIKDLFTNQQLQIPIEIQIYNIINYVPASIDTGLKMTLIPKHELLHINTFKSQDEFFETNIQNKYYPEQLSGYRDTEVNFCYLLNVLSVDLIIEIYLNLLSGRVIGFFYENISELSIIMHIFHQFLFPFAPNENVACLPPIKFFCTDTVSQNIVGFLCNYDDLEMYDPFREVKEGEYRCMTDEEENIQLDPLFFRCDYILDLNTKVLKEPDKYISSTENDNYKQNKKLNDFIKKIITKFSKGSVETEFERMLFKLYHSLKENLYKLTSFQKMKKKFFHPFLRKDTEFMNHFILESFYKFNLNFAYIYYTKISPYKGDYRISKEEQINSQLISQKDSELNPDEYLFFSCFGNSLFGNCLDNFIGGYSTKEPKIYKGPKLIFEHLLYFLRIKHLYDLADKRLPDILDIYDELYTNKIKDINNDNEQDNKININIKENNQFLFDTNDEEIKKINHKTFTFFEFYKYYVSNPDMAPYFYNIADPEYVNGKITKKSSQNIKYTFKYKKFALDQNIIFKYIYKLRQMDEKTKAKLFKDIIQKEAIPPEQIKSYDNFITSGLEKYYIKNKIIDNLELLNFSILGIVILTISKHKLVYFIDAINEIIRNLQFLSRKFTEILLSIALRVFSKQKNKNLFICEKYFDIYKLAIEKKLIFPNDELIILQKKISKFIHSIGDREEIDLTELGKSLDEANKKSYNLKFNESLLKKFNFLDLTQDVKKIDIKFTMNKKKIEYNIVYHIQKIYDKICTYLDVYYKDLNYDIILNDKEEFNKIIIYLLFYVTALKNKKGKHHSDAESKIYFPQEIEMFLINSLEII